MHGFGWGLPLIDPGCSKGNARHGTDNNLHRFPSHCLYSAVTDLLYDAVLSGDDCLNYGRLAICIAISPPRSQSASRAPFLWAEVMALKELENEGVAAWNPPLTPDSSERCQGLDSWAHIHSCIPTPTSDRCTHSTKGQTRGEILMLRRGRELFCSSSLRPLRSADQQCNSGEARHGEILCLWAQWVLNIPGEYRLRCSLSESLCVPTACPVTCSRFSVQKI